MALMAEWIPWAKRRH